MAGPTLQHHSIHKDVALLEETMQAEAIWHGMARVFICV
jgi:hypothetical protein